MAIENSITLAGSFHSAATECCTRQQIVAMPSTVVSSQAARRGRRRSIHTTCSSLSASVSGHTLHGKLILCNAQATKCPNVVRMPSCQERRRSGAKQVVQDSQGQLGSWAALVAFWWAMPGGAVPSSGWLCHTAIAPASYPWIWPLPILACLWDSSGSAYVCIPFWHFCT